MTFEDKFALDADTGQTLVIALHARTKAEWIWFKRCLEPLRLSRSGGGELHAKKARSERGKICVAQICCTDMQRRHVSD